MDSLAIFLGAALAITVGALVGIWALLAAIHSLLSEILDELKKK